MIDEMGVRDWEERTNNSGLGQTRVKLKANIILIAPREAHLRTLTKALQEHDSAPAAVLTSYPSANAIGSLADTDCDAIVIEIDTDSDTALDVVEAVCARKPTATMMVYSGAPDPKLMMASMRAGAREFLSGAIPSDVMAEALVRAAARRADAGLKKTQGKVLLFWGAKGGGGVTTLAANFALALQEEAGGEVALADLNPQLGDAAVLLGLKPQFTLEDALRNTERLDEDFVAAILTKHRSGLSVLAAPDSYTLPEIADRGIAAKLVELVGGRFRYVVVDAGLGLGPGAGAIFRRAGTVYLVTQADIPSLRNCHRLLAYLRNFNGVSVELVLNRFEPRKLEFDEEQLSKAIGMPPTWKVPNDYSTARRAANTGKPLIAERSPVSEMLRRMAQAACGKLAQGERRKGFRIFG